MDGINIEMPEEVEVDITIKSDSDDTYTLTKTDGRHFICNYGNLALENIILDGGSTGGGISVGGSSFTEENCEVTGNMAKYDCGVCEL